MLRFFCSAQVRKATRVRKLAKIIASKRHFRSRLDAINERMVEVSREFSGDTDPFLDEEVWPTPWREGEGRDEVVGHLDPVPFAAEGSNDNYC